MKIGTGKNPRGGVVIQLQVEGRGHHRDAGPCATRVSAAVEKQLKAVKEY